MATIKVPIMRGVVGTDTLNGIPVRLLGFTAGELRRMREIKSNAEAEKFQCETLPALLEGENGETLEFNSDDLTSLEINRIFRRVCECNKTSFENSGVTDFTKPPASAGSGGSSGTRKKR